MYSIENRDETVFDDFDGYLSALNTLKGLYFLLKPAKIILILMLSFVASCLG